MVTTPSGYLNMVLVRCTRTAAAPIGASVDQLPFIATADKHLESPPAGTLARYGYRIFADVRSKIGPHVDFAKKRASGARPAKPSFPPDAARPRE